MNKQGLCPQCGNNNLGYASIVEVEDENVFYSVICLECGFEGKEYYSTCFIYYMDDDGNEMT